MRSRVRLPSLAPVYALQINNLQGFCFFVDTIFITPLLSIIFYYIIVKGRLKDNQFDIYS